MKILLTLKMIIVKKKPVWLHQCNMFQINGCSVYCNQYTEGALWNTCKHRKMLCKILTKGLNELIGDYK